jgi:hypothetical protein
MKINFESTQLQLRNQTMHIQQYNKKYEENTESLVGDEINVTSKDDIFASASRWLWRARSTSSCQACICSHTSKRYTHSKTILTSKTPCATSAFHTKGMKYNSKLSPQRQKDVLIFT